LCDRIAIIDRGRIVKIGTPVELKAGIGGDVIEISIKEGATDITELISRTEGVTDVKRNGSNYRVKAPVGEEAAPAIIDAIRAKGFHVSRISLSKPSMDQVYLEYTGKEMRDENVDSTQMMSQRLTMRRARS